MFSAPLKKKPPPPPPPHTHTLTHTQYFMDYWNLLEFACNGLLTSCCVIWWIFVTDHIHPFTISLRHNVYKDLQARARFLELADG